MPSLLSAIIQPDRKKAELKAHQAVHSLSFKSSKSTANTSHPNQSSSQHPDHQPSRAEQKALRQEQKEKDIAAGILVLKEDNALVEKASKPVVRIDDAQRARFGVLEHSGRGFSFGAFLPVTVSYCTCLWWRFQSCFGLAFVEYSHLKI